jgi:hypothetical protein
MQNNGADLMNNFYDYSVTTAKLNLKFTSLNHALNDKQWLAANTIIQDLRNDLDNIESWLESKIKGIEK